MKNIIAALVLCVALATTSLDADAAKRFGGGLSTGRAAPTFSQKAPVAPAAAPTAQQRQQQAGSTAQQQRQNAATNTPAQRPSMMRSILGGLAAALGISALLSMLGLGGAGISSIVMGLLLAVVVFFAVRFFLSRGRQQRPATSGPQGAAPDPWQQQRREPEPAREPMRREAEQAPAWQQSSQGVRSGSVMDQLAGGASQQAAAEPVYEGAVDVTPADFDREGFLKAARENYIKLQKAWDTGNVIEISDFTDNDLFTAITQQLRARKGEVYETVVEKLDNELLGIALEDGTYVAAVRFTGRVVVSGDVEDLDETWVLTKPARGEGGWLLSGIRQNGPQA
ncbi:Tim44 domain-containing protein [Sutterella sp.]|uniref:Tim44 domain-containing protein n=1 Tax=Sutterella sp. TaxID=1981025 RepID=UPI0026DEEA5B|nr:TIM44-like domain-containing protein [Sutterella sp.]MDO5530457.1 TIM44-like domain-containing protein [Sutterella sp.]